MKNILKIPKFQENSERYIGTQTIQINYLELMKQILEPFNK
jgi:hypothetical protein